MDPFLRDGPHFPSETSQANGRQQLECLPTGVWLIIKTFRIGFNITYDEASWSIAETGVLRDS